ncbi:MAG: Ig-like domain-containing protein [Lachnospiraceae bacterium]|nr:Ig-like domain-containing protein [Lachnospiraceae bacterium]
MGKNRLRKANLWKVVLPALFVIVFVMALFAARMGMRSAAEDATQDEYSILVDDKATDSYELKEAEKTIFFAKNGVIESTTTGKVTWSIPQESLQYLQFDGVTGDELIQTSGQAKVTLKAIKAYSEPVVVMVTKEDATGNPIGTASISIKISPAVMKNAAPVGEGKGMWKQVLKTDVDTGTSSLVMSGKKNTSCKLKMNVTNGMYYWEVVGGASNVISVAGILDGDKQVEANVTIIGAGCSAIKVTDESGEPVETINVYVMPQFKALKADADLNEEVTDYDSSTGSNVSKEVSNGSWIKTNYFFDESNRHLESNIFWEVVDASDNTVVADQNGKQSENIEIEKSDGVHGDCLKIKKIKHGNYILKMYPCTKPETMQGYSDGTTEIYSSLTLVATSYDEMSVSVGVGDEIDLSEMFLLPKSLFDDSSVKIFYGTGSDFKAIALNNENKATKYMKKTNAYTVSALKKTVENEVIIVQITPAGINGTKILYVQISDTMILKVSDVELAVGAEMDLYDTLNVAGTTINGLDVEGEITWSTSDEKFVSVDDNGHIKALAETTSLAGRCAVITVKVRYDNGITKTAYCNVYVEPSVSLIRLTPDDVELSGVGDKEYVTATISGDDTASKIQWKLICDTEECVTMEVMPDNKTVQLTSVKPGTATLLVINVDSNLVMAFAKITVIEKITNLAFDQVYQTVSVKDGYIKLTPKVTPNLKDLSNLYWYANNSTIIQELMVEKDGCLVKFGKAGAVDISVYPSAKDRSISATVHLTILPAATSIQISSTVSLEAGESRTLEAVILPAEAKTVVKWYSTDKTIVTADEKSGTIKGVKPGKAEIYAVSEEGCQSICLVTVTRKATGINFTDQSVIVIEKGTSLDVSGRVKLTPADATSTIRWGTTESKIASVDGNGILKGVSVGTTYLFAGTESYLSQMITVQVIIPSTGITLPAEMTLNLSIDAEKTKAIDYKLTADNSTANLVWKTTDPKICTVNEKGIVSAVSVGNTYILVYSKNGNLSGYVLVHVIMAAEGISLNDDEIIIDVGEEYHMTYAVTPAGSSGYKVTWSCQHEKIAKVDQNGVITGVSEGTTFVMAKLATGAVQYVTVNVVFKAKGIALSRDTLELVKGDTFTMNVTFTPEQTTNKQMNWSSDNALIASVSSKGKIKGLKGGTTIIRAVSEDGNYKAECVVYVIEEVSKMKLNHSSYNLPVGKSFMLTAKVTSNSASNKKVKWTSSNSRIASVSSSGQVFGKKIGTCKITAKTTDGSIISKSCTVRVIKRATGIQINKVYLKVIEGHSKKIKAKVTPSNATIKNLSWSSSDETIAMVSNTGKITGITPGTCKVTAKTTDGSKLKVSCNVIVLKEVPATGIDLKASDMILVKGTSQSAGVQISPSNSTDTLYYYSDNKAVASVSSKGKIKAKRPGNCTITVSTTGGLEAYINVTVVGLNKTKLNLEQYDSDELWVEGISSNVKWSSSNPSVARVNDGTVVGRRVGSCTITASVNGVKLYCKVKVKAIKK